MSLVISKDLDGRGTRFVNSHLEAGGVLARAVLSVCGPVTNAVAPLPKELDPNTLPDFEHGGVTSLDATVDWLMLKVFKPYSEGSRFLFVVEDPWVTLSDVSDSYNEQRFKVSEKDCLLYATGGDQLSGLTLKGIFKIVRSFCFSGFVVDSASLPVFPTGAIAASDLAKHVKSVFVSAFDRDGVIIADWA